MRVNRISKIAVMNRILIASLVVSMAFLAFSAPPAKAATTVDGTIAGSAFSPTPITIQVGDTVRWTNNDAVTHTVTSDTSVFNSGSISNGGTYSYTFTMPGTYGYHCSIHPSMTGEIIVQSTSGSAPTAPQNLQASAGNGYVRLTWSAPTTAGSSAITNYTVYRGTSSGSLASYKVLGNVTTYNDTAVTNGNTYYYAVTATNGVGESIQSAAASGAPTAPGGGAPADNTMLIVAIVLIIIVVIVIAAVMMRRKGGAEKPKE